MHRPSKPRPRSTWKSVAIFFAMLVLWWGVLTLALVIVYPDFLFRVQHPVQWAGGGRSLELILFYSLLSIPLFPLYNRLDDWLERRRRSQVQVQSPPVASTVDP